MTAVEMPIYVVALRDEWVTLSALHDAVDDCNIAFGSKEGAEDFARRTAEQMNLPPALFRIVEYTFSGKVCEV